jgi:hypothetical protein
LIVVRASPVASIRRIALGLPNNAYFKILGISIESRHGVTQMAQAANLPMHVLSGRKTLKSLELSFYIAQSGIYTSVDPFFPRRRLGVQFEIYCQKKIVDWMLTLMHAYVRHIPRITLSGHVKNSTRTKWEAIYDDERKDISRDLSPALQVILSSVPSQYL